MSRTGSTDGDGRSRSTDEYLFDLMCYTVSERIDDGFEASKFAALSTEGDAQNSDDAEGRSLGFSLNIEQKHRFHAKFAVHWAFENNCSNRSRTADFCPSRGELDNAAHRLLVDFLEDDAGGVAAQKKDESNVSKPGSESKPASLITVLRLVNEFPLWVREFAGSGVGSMSIEDIQGLTRQTPWLLPKVSAFSLQFQLVFLD